MWMPGSSPGMTVWWGAVHSEWIRALAARFPVFSAALDRCAVIYRRLCGGELRDLLWTAPQSELDRTENAQPALFALEYALSALWRSWGIEPAALIGHSVGEYVAAHLAGVMSLEDAFGLLIRRADLMGALPAGGAMLAVAAAAAPVRALIATAPAGLELAALNGPEAVVVAGPQEAIAALAARCAAEGLSCSPLAVSHAFHSTAMEPAMAGLEAAAAALTLTPPRLPLASNVSGALAGSDMACPRYWSRHLREPVRFHDGIRTLAQAGHRLFLEIGPRPVLSRLVRAADPALEALPSLAPGREVETLLTSLGQLYVHGAAVTWSEIDRHEQPRKTSLPTYPFQRQSYWLDARSDSDNQVSEPDISNLLYARSWTAKLHLAETVLARLEGHGGAWLIAFSPGGGIGGRIAEFLAQRGENTLALPPSAENGDCAEDLLRTDTHLAGLIYCAETLGEGGLNEKVLIHSLDFLRLLKAAEDRSVSGPLPVHLITCGAQAVSDSSELTHPELAGLLGIGRSAVHELSGVRLAMADLDAAGGDDGLALLVEDILTGTAEPETAYRRGERHVPVLAATTPPEARPLDLHEGTLLITGAFGGIGVELAEAAVGMGARHLALMARRPPSPEIRARLDSWRERGAVVHLLPADFEDMEAVAQSLSRLAAAAPPVVGVFHLAGALADGALMKLDADAVRRVIAPKVAGIEALQHVLSHHRPRFVLLFSSLAAVVGAPAQANYAAANAVLDACAHTLRASGINATSIAWGPWKDFGMAAKLAHGATAGNLVHVPPLDARQGFAALFRLAASDRVNIVAADLQAVFGIGTDALSQGLPPCDVGRRLWRCDHPNPSATTPSRTPALDPVDNAPLEDRLAILTEVIRDSVAKLLGESAVSKIGTDTPFEDLGLDSLTIIHMRNGLNEAYAVNLSSTAPYKYPTCQRLAAHLVELLKDRNEITQPNVKAAMTTTRVEPAPMTTNLCDDDDLEAVSGEALLAVLWKELASIKNHCAE